MTISKSFKWLFVLIAVAGVIGSAAAFFLWSLDAVTRNRFENPWMIWLLPLAGCAMGFYYRFHGKTVHSANALILDDIQNESTRIPSRLAPSILISTLVTHAFGGSAGREGTAVQMGAGIAASFARFVASTRSWIWCGIWNPFRRCGVRFGIHPPPHLKPQPAAVFIHCTRRSPHLPHMGHLPHSLSNH
jgi:H+/Cl- antiporter ClcA